MDNRGVSRITSGMGKMGESGIVRGETKISRGGTVSRDHVEQGGPQWGPVDRWGRPGHSRVRAHRVEQNAVLLVLLGVKHIVTVGRGRSEIRPGAITCSASTPAAPASPFLAESNTHEARLVGPVRFHSVVPPAKPSALAPPRDRSREGSDLDASPKEGRGCAHVLAAGGFVLGSPR